MMRLRQNREAAYSDEKQAQQKGNGKQAALIVDHIGRHISACNCRGSYEDGQHERNAGGQLGNGCGTTLGTEAIGRRCEARGLNELWHEEP